MTFIPYELAAKISLINVVSPAITRMVADLGGLEHKIASVTKSFEKMGTAGKLAFGGAAGIGVGVGIFEGLKYAVDKAKDLNHELVQLQKLGLNPLQYDQAKAAAFALHAQVPGMTSAGASKLYGASYSAIGHENALKIMKAEGEFVQVLGAQTGDYKGAVDKIYNMVRAGDLMGKFMNSMTHQVDVTKLQHFFDLGARVITATHGRVSADTWLALAQQGGPAMGGMTDEGLLTMAMVAQGMGGHRGGTALSSIYQQLIGGTMTEYRAKQFHEMGVVGDYRVGKGGKIVWPEGSLDTPATRALKENPMEFVKILQQKLVERGFTTIDQQVPELYKLFQRQTSVREIHDMLRNMPQMEQERERIKGGLGISTAANLQNTKDVTQVMHNFSAAWDELMAHIGTPVVEQVAIPTLKSLTKAIDGLTEWAKTHQTEIGNIAKGLAVLAAGLTALGAAAVVAALTMFVPGGVGILGLIGLASGLTALGAFKDWGLIKQIDKLGDYITDAFQAMFNKVGEWLKSWLPDWALKQKASWGGSLGGGGGLINASYGGGSGASIGGSPHGKYLQYANLIKQYGGDEAENLMKIYRTEGPMGYAVGDGGKSFGPFQAYTGGGIGNQMLAAGINIRDPSSVPAQIEWMKNYGHRHGGYSSSIWHGLRDKGIGSLRSGAGVTPYSGSKGQQEVHVHVPVSLDGKMIASNTVTHVLKSSEHSRQSPYFDGYGHFAGADRQTATA